MTPMTPTERRARLLDALDRRDPDVIDALIDHTRRQLLDADLREMLFATAMDEYNELLAEMRIRRIEPPPQQVM